MKEYFEIGQIVNTNGLKGVLKVKPFTDDITKFERLKAIYIDFKGNLRAFKIEKVWYHKQMVMLKLEGINSIEEAEKYRNCFIRIDRKDEEELPEDVYYIQDLIDCVVYTDESVILGTLKDVFPTGSNDVYVVKAEDGKEILLPAIGDVIKEVDIQNKKITVHLLDGLIS